MLEPDRDELEIFVEALFCHAGGQGFVSLRAFFESDDVRPFRITPTNLAGGLPFLIDVAEDDARRAANCPRPVVFCPPIASFHGASGAAEKDISEGYALSVECDANPQTARERLERILGPATAVVRSGGVWIDPQTGDQCRQAAFALALSRAGDRQGAHAAEASARGGDAPGRW